jgi:hypothetical protein
MNRMSSSRVFLAAAVVLTLTFVSVAPAGAQSFRHSRSVFDLPTNWVKIATTWLGDLLPTGKTPQPTARVVEKVGVLIPEGGFGESGSMTGVCVDPNGNRVPCRVGM